MGVGPLLLARAAGLPTARLPAGRARRTRRPARAGGAATGRGRPALHVAATTALAALVAARRCRAGAIGARPRLIPARGAGAGRARAAHVHAGAAAFAALADAGARFPADAGTRGDADPDRESRPMVPADYRGARLVIHKATEFLLFDE